MGYERRNNLALQFDNRANFVAYMSEGQPTRPANVLNIVAINQGRLPLTMDMPQSVSLTAARISDCIAEGHLVIDGRSPPMEVKSRSGRRRATGYTIASAIA